MKNGIQEILALFGYMAGWVMICLISILGIPMLLGALIWSLIQDLKRDKKNDY